MKIALVVPDDLSVILFCKEIISSLLSIAGARVFVVCEMTKYRGEIEKLGCIPTEIGAYRFFHPLKDFKYILRLERFFRINSIDIVFNFATKQNIYGTIAARLACVRTIFSHVVGLGSAFNEQCDFRGRLLRITTGLLYRLVGLWSHKIWFTNKNDRQLFVDSDIVPESKTVLTQNYLDVREYSFACVSSVRQERARILSAVSHMEQVVVMVARMIWSKGIREFVEAAVLLKGCCPKLKFILIAPLEAGSFGAVPEEFVRAYEDRCNFAWLGFQEDVKSFYAIADLAVLPSYYKEGGYPRALLEPMAMGKPLIATDTDGCRGTVENGLNGFLVPPQDAAALAESITKIMGNEVLREQMGNYSKIKAYRDFDERSIVPSALRALGLPIASRL